MIKTAPSKPQTLRPHNHWQSVFTDKAGHTDGLLIGTGHNVDHVEHAQSIEQAENHRHQQCRFDQRQGHFENTLTDERYPP